MKTKAIFTQLFVLLLLVGGTQVYAQGRMHHNQSERQGKCQNIPDLTEEQQDQIDQIRQNHYKETKELHAELEILRAEKQKLMIADNPDAKAINAKIDEMAEIRTQIQKSKTAMHLTIRELLTEEQKMHFDKHHNAKHKRGMHGQMDMKPEHRSHRHGSHDGSCKK